MMMTFLQQYKKKDIHGEGNIRFILGTFYHRCAQYQHLHCIATGWSIVRFIHSTIQLADRFTDDGIEAVAKIKKGTFPDDYFENGVEVFNKLLLF